MCVQKVGVHFFNTFFFEYCLLFQVEYNLTFYKNEIPKPSLPTPPVLDPTVDGFALDRAWRRFARIGILHSSNSISEACNQADTRDNASNFQENLIIYNIF